MSNGKQRGGGEMESDVSDVSDGKHQSGIYERVSRLETQRNMVGAFAALLFVGLAGGAVKVMLLTERLDERYASEHAASASVRAQVEALSSSVGNLGRFDERLTAMNASVTRIETETQRLRESVDQLRSDVLRSQARHASQVATLSVRLNPAVLARRSHRRKSL